MGDASTAAGADACCLKIYTRNHVIGEEPRTPPLLPRVGDMQMFPAPNCLKRAKRLVGDCCTGMSVSGENDLSPPSHALSIISTVCSRKGSPTVTMSDVYIKKLIFVFSNCKNHYFEYRISSSIFLQVIRSYL